ncbi:PD-(D/E)XK nuclease family protein [Prosthecobacter sp.]|uniref:PD-(D/E)XK nuclease family protein n=1 Tax=Prosthecobacter sp. TaxID=1965333 RepID=UPI003782DE3D
MSGKVQRLFWGWDAPVLEKAVAYLCRGWDGRQALDLSSTLLLVPNGEAGRRLREALAQTTNETGTAALVPHLWLPEQALLPQTRRHVAATALQAQMAWQRALERVPLEELKALFPKLPKERGWGWEAETARMLGELKMLLGTGGLTFADTASAPAAQRDAARWQDLAKIEEVYFEELANAMVTDGQALKRRHAHEPVLPEGVEKIVVLASPDLPPLLDAWIAGCAKRGVGVVVAVQAPEAMAHSFDACGRPLPLYWGEYAENSLPFDDGQIDVMRDPSTQATRTLDLMRELVPQGRTALGVCDAEVGSLLLEKLALEEARSFEPGGTPVQREGLWHVLECFRVLLSTGAWRAFAALLRIEEFRDAVIPRVAGAKVIPMDGANGDEGDGARKPSVSALLRAADDFTSEHLPVTLAHAKELPLARYPALLPAVKHTMDLLDELKKQTPTQAARTLILRLLGEREFNPEAPGHRERTELASEWLRITEELEQEAQRFGLKPNAEDTFSLSLECLAQSRLAEPRGEIDLVLQGWLELLWEKSPNLIVTGLNEEHVPGIFISHPFLPDGLRNALGLPCQNTRFARDAFILAALAQQRLGERGKLRLLCGQWSDGGDALRPSRLLFLCDNKVLPQRVAHLFPKEEEQQAEAEPKRVLAWPLRPDWRPKAVETISTSRLRQYLGCPFRYYLTYTRNMAAVETGKRELDAAEFGNLIHHAFHRLSLEASMKDCTHPGQITECLEAAARERVREIYGERPAPLITLQLDSILQRLQQAAKVEALNRQQGWRCIEAELKIGGEEDALPFLIGGARLKGRIDRVEKHVDGTLRIVDFKSSDKPRPPEESHYKVITTRTKLTEADEWKCFDLPDGKRGLWLDLQLPLYAAALQQRGQPVSRVAYFALPKSIQETEILSWEDFDEELMAAALACAAEAVKRIREGVFWPPAERAANGSYEEMLLGDPMYSVQPPLA